MIKFIKETGRNLSEESDADIDGIKEHYKRWLAPVKITSSCRKAVGAMEAIFVQLGIRRPIKERHLSVVRNFLAVSKLSDEVVLDIMTKVLDRSDHYHVATFARCLLDNNIDTSKMNLENNPNTCRSFREYLTATVQKYPSSEDDDSKRFERYFKAANAFTRVVLDRLDAVDDNGVDEDGADENSANENWGDIFNLSPILDLEAPRKGLSGLSMPPLGTDIMELAARAEDTGDGWDLWDFRTQFEQAEDEAIVAVGAEAEPVPDEDEAVQEEAVQEEEEEETAEASLSLWL